MAFLLQEQEPGTAMLVKIMLLKDWRINPGNSQSLGRYCTQTLTLSVSWSLTDQQVNFSTATENHWRNASSLSLLYVQFQEGESGLWTLIAHWGAWCQNGRSLFWRVGFRVTWVTKHFQEPLGTSANNKLVTVSPIHWRVRARESKRDKNLLFPSISLNFQQCQVPESVSVSVLLYCMYVGLPKQTTNAERIRDILIELSCWSQSESFSNDYLPIPNPKMIFLFSYITQLCGAQ